MTSDYQALRYCVERSHGSQLAKSKILKRLEKDKKRGREVEASNAGWKKAFCCARLMMGDYSNWDGWQFRSDYAATCWYEGEGRLGIPRWDGSPVEHLLILAEEGVGDEVLFMSLLPEALCRAKQVTVECDERLQKILERSFPRTRTVSRRGTLTNVRHWLTDLSAAGFAAGSSTGSTSTGSHALQSTCAPSNWILMGDLARYFRRDKSHFPGKPYLRPDPERVREMESFRNRIGMSWAGNHGRYDTTEMLTAISGLTTKPINLQYDGASSLLEEAGIDLKNDLEGLFALCSILDRVVTVSTSVAHIAGSVGCPVDVIHAPPNSGGKNDMDILNWKWGPEGKTPWYGSARVFRNLKQYEMTR